MEKTNWIQLIFGILGGGVCGAFVKQYFDNKRNKIQPIAKSVEVKSFYDSVENTLLNSQITLSGVDKEYKFSKLYTGTFKITNVGLNDYPEFKFGITCPENVKIIHLKTNSPDRHHLTEISDLPTLENQVSVFDISLMPFNRKDSYFFDILVTTTSGELSTSDIEIISSMPIKWVDMQATSKLILEIAKEKIFAFGPILVGLKR